MSIKHFKLTLILVALTWNFSFSQKIDSLFFSSKEEVLLQLHEEITNAPIKTKGDAEKIFQDTLVQILRKQASFYYTFPQLKNIGRISSDDGQLNIFSWNIPESGGFNSYYCVLQYSPKRSDLVYVYPLHEAMHKATKDNQMISDTNTWVSSLYYEIVTTKYKGQVFYTLLGFNFNDILSNIKLIDILSFDNNKPYFPSGKFVYEGKVLNRIVFEYNERVQMTLEYNPTMKMIIFDHLSPSRPSLEGNYQFYGPDFSYDALLFDDDIWKHQSDVQVTY
jgi:hypothetical protein